MFEYYFLYNIQISSIRVDRRFFLFGFSECFGFYIRKLDLEDSKVIITDWDI